MDLAPDTLQALWTASITVIPLALGVALLGSIARCRPATRHALWLCVLLSLLAPLLLQLAGIRNPIRAIGSTVEQTAQAARLAADVERARRMPITAPAPADAEPKAATRFPDQILAIAPSKAPALTDLSHVAITRQPPAPTRSPRITMSTPLVTSAPRLSTLDERPAGRTLAPAPRSPHHTDGGSEPQPQALPQRQAISPTDTHPTIHYASPVIEPDEPTGPAPTPQLSADDDDDAPADEPSPLLAGAAGAPPFRTDPSGAPPSAARSAGTAITGALGVVRATTIARLREAGAAWSTWFAELRLALIHLPPIPPAFWLFGIGLVLVGWLARSARSRHVLKGARPAPREILTLVEHEAQRLGLRRVPRVVIVDARISPSIVCDVRPTLAIPVDLWAQFDDASRRAAVVHELAHLRRRDHWVMWIEAIVGAIYWWHPVVWWVRKRIREEADLCCDAWVTALMPKERRAYAEALVLTKAFLSCPGPRVERVGIGMASAHAKRFARRVTMVMTQRSAPRMSAWGLALAATIGIAGTLAAPSIACPPEKENKQEAKTIVIAPTPAAAPATPGVPVPPRTPAPPHAPGAHAGALAPGAAGGDASTFERHMAEREREAATARSFAGTPQPDGDRIRQLEERIERLEQRIDHLIEIIESRPAGSGASWTVPDDGAKIDRLYRLPEGKLQSLSQLMVRSDVPIFVSPQEEGIVVSATPRQHQIFNQFVALIDPEHQEQVSGFVADQAAFAQYADAFAVAAASQDSQVARARYQNEIETLRTQAEQQRNAARAQRDSQRQVERAMNQMQRRAEHLNERAEQLQERADEARDTAEEAMNEAENDQQRARAEQMLARAEQYTAQADAARQEAEAMQMQAEDLEAQIEQLEDQAAELEEEAEALDSDAESLSDELSEEVDTVESDDCDESCDDACAGCEDCEDCCEDD